MRIGNAVKRFSFNVGFLILSLAGFGFAEPEIFKQYGIKVLEERNLGSLKELVVERNGKKMLIYMSKDGKYLLIGALVDAKTGKNLTKERYREINRVDVSKLPLEDALKITFGKGGKKLIMISDPDCPFCRKAHAYLKNKNVELYVFLFPLNIHPEAFSKSVRILCSEDKTKAYDTALSGGEVKADRCKEGEDRLKKHILVGQIIGVSGTPLFIREDGIRIEGFNVKELEDYLGGKGR